jgi:MscS family membrane protein
MFQQFLDLNLKNHLLYWVVGSIVTVLVIQKYLSKYIAVFFYNIFKRMGRKPEREAYYTLLVKPLQNFLVAFIIVVSLEKLTLPDGVSHYSLYGKLTISQFLNVVSKIIVIILFTNLLIKIVDYIAVILEKKANLTKGQDDNQLIVFFKDFFKVILVIIGFLLILKYAFGQNIGNLLTGLSIVGAAIALATKESLENLIASFVIFFDKPFVTGDSVKVQNVEGKVEKIGLRSTRIRTLDTTYVTVPNKQMVDSIVDNKSLRKQYKITLVLDLDKKTAIEKIKRLCTAIEEKVEREPEVVNSAVLFHEINKEAIQVQVSFFTHHFEDDAVALLKQRMNYEILSLVMQNEILFAEIHR